KDSLLLRTHCQTSGWSLAAQDPFNNVARTTIEALAAVLGGTQSLHTNSYDEALGLPTEASSRAARNTQLIIAEESHVTEVVDPLGGSYYVEALTDALVRSASEIIAEVESYGGMTKAINAGIPKMRIEESAARRQALIDQGKEVIVGVNAYRLTHEPEIDVLDIDNTSVRESQVARLTSIRSSRNSAEVQRTLELLTRAASSSGGNLLTIAVEAARARATVGEITDAMAAIFTRFEAHTVAIEGVYGAQYAHDPEYAALRANVEQFEKEFGRRPRILVAKLGQ
ncbi:MAG: methylmalonyl-CoA mutase family protein, partial [Candidatus Kapabacteria bacterium]|nr:methylmalonyl-CoA mutase family protein [Candidatus Kapabacteria bacterium]